jgi:N-acetylmuramoyl-L-alanine amidase
MRVCQIERERPQLRIWFPAILIGAVLFAVSPGERPAGGTSPLSASSADAAILRLRVGNYPTYTRVVLDTAGPLEWSIHNAERGGLWIVVPGAVLPPGIRSVELRHGILRAIQPVQRAGGVEIRLLPQHGSAKVRAFSLTDPDRIVVDVLSTESEGQPNGHPEPSSSSTSATPRTGAAGSGKELHGAGITVVLDPGHGGHDTGAVGPTGLMEKDVVLDLALRLQRLLQERLGLRVILTRSEDVFVPLQERSALANRAKADFFISLHINGSSQRDALGFETYYFTQEPSDTDARESAQRENLAIERNGASGEGLESLLRITLADLAVTRDIRESSELAELVLASLDGIMRVENRGVKSGPFRVLATATMPAILVESAFITNPKEERKLRRDEYRQRIAEALCEGIGKFMTRYERRLGIRGGASVEPGS